jgi:hypothetical protein
MKMGKHEAVFTGERCAVYTWTGVTDGDSEKPIRCDAHKPCVLQAVGVFTKAYLEGSCDGKNWETIAFLSLPGITAVNLAPLYVRPLVTGGTADITVVVRR